MTPLSPVASTASDANEGGEVAGEAADEDLLPGEKIIHVGWLYKKTQKMWKRRWFVLRPHQLAYYKDEKEYKVLRVIPVTEMTASVHLNGVVFGLFTRNRTFYLSADTSADTDSWVDSIRKTADLADHIEDNQLTSTTIDISHHANGTPSEVFSFSEGTSQGYLSGSDNKSPIEPHPRYATIGSSYTLEKPDIMEDKVLMQGHIEIHSRLKMKRRWIVLRGKSLAFYSDSGEYKAKKIIPMTDIVDVVEVDGVSKHKDLCFQIITDRKVYRMVASSEETFNRWLAAFAIAKQKAIGS